MQTIQWKRKPLGPSVAETFVGNLSALFAPRCPECAYLLQGKPIEIIADFAGWHLGWQRYSCVRCGLLGSRLVLSRSAHHLEYQTHPIR